ncbi:uncharacterized protein LOC141612726 [Silene latifolia]|uniref:uncharacterized protein LOC141612726 n=1 Tax=Silene latifolia TaxID=37657 RepID=UPI003D76A706
MSENSYLSDSASNPNYSNSVNDWDQNTIFFNQWQNRIMEENRVMDRILEDSLIYNPNPFFQPQNQTPRSNRRYIERNREQGYEQLFNDYFADDPVYPAHIFRRRFRMQKHVFLRIVEALSTSDDFFEQSPNGSGRLGFAALQKCTAAIRVLAYGASADSLDEYLRMSEQVIRESVVHFVEGVIANFGTQYLRTPNEEDLARLLYVGQQRGFPGMLGSIDCMHWEWKNCPTAWAGQYAGRSTKTSIILEAVASHDLWIWHAFFGTPGSCNDINVLQRSPVFNDILEGRAPQVNFVVNGQQYNMGYYLTDGIYPSWATFVKSITAPQLRKHKLFAQYQEAARKDVERAFGVLQARFSFIKRPCRIWNPSIIGKIMMACIIMHNMIVEDERDTYLNHWDTTEFNEDMSTERSAINGDEVPDNGTSQFSIGDSSLTGYMQRRSQLRDKNTHNNLKSDLIEHIWETFGNVN